MSEPNDTTGFNRRCDRIFLVADDLAKLLAGEQDPMFGTVQSAAVESVNEALRGHGLPLRLAHRKVGVKPAKGER